MSLETTRDVAFFADPSDIVKSIDGMLYDQPGTDLIAADPSVYFAAADEDNVIDFCMKIDLGAPLPTGIFTIGGEDVPLLANEFVRGRPPQRPPGIQQ